MKVTVQFYSFLRTLVGQTELPFDLPAHATVLDLLARLYALYPRLRGAEPTTLIAVNVEFAKREQELQDGDVVSLMPPLQGGSEPPVVELVLTDAPIAEAEAQLGELTGNVGAVVTFWGVVRDREDSQPIRALEYTAYRAMAEHQFRKLLDQARQRWPLKRIRVIHRLGVIAVGEPSLLVRVEAGHRSEAFAAAQFIIDELKQTVPIWKQAAPAK